MTTFDDGTPKKAENMAQVAEAEAIETLNQVLAGYAKLLGLPTDPTDTEDILLAIETLQTERDALRAALRARAEAKAGQVTMAQAVISYHRERAWAAHALPGSWDRINHEHNANEALLILRSSAVQQAAQVQAEGTR